MPKTKKGKRGNAAKKVKDPNKPTGKRSAYMYCMAGDERIMLKTEQPGKVGCMVYRLGNTPRRAGL